MTYKIIFKINLIKVISLFNIAEANPRESKFVYQKFDISPHSRKIVDSNFQFRFYF
jgi:hypothetical protein